METAKKNIRGNSLDTGSALILTVVLTSLLAIVGVLFVMGIRPGHAGFVAYITVVLNFTGMLMASLMLVRHRGYRLVRVQQADSPEYSQLTDRALLVHPASRASSRTSSST